MRRYKSRAAVGAVTTLCAKAMRQIPRNIFYPQYRGGLFGVLFTSLFLIALRQPIAAQPDSGSTRPEFPEQLIQANEILPGWQVTAGSFQMGPRNLIVCRGPRFQGQPPDTPDMQVSWQGRSWRSLGRLSNAITAELLKTDRAEQLQLRSLAATMQGLLDQYPDFWPLRFNLMRVLGTIHQDQAALRQVPILAGSIPGYSGLYYQGMRLAARLKADTLVKDYASRCRQLDPAELRCQTALGDYYASRGALAHARRQYTTALATQPQFLPAILGQARLLAVERQQNEARRLLLTVDTGPEAPLWLDKSNQESRAVFYYELAELHFQLRDYRRAVAAYQQALDLPESL
ncbi:MAG: hypothetical protein KDK39_07330, partial [Leptospiraceae bacterium]|nr:hypothetical protein [Leptospiraceae bacterium]